LSAGSEIFFWGIFYRIYSRIKGIGMGILIV
jgi:hypothetical protein